MTGWDFREMIVAMEDFISHHPLFERWKMLRRRDVLCSEWKADFRVFLAGVGERPADCKKLVRDNKDRPYGPGNARWGKTPTADESREYIREWHRARPEYSKNLHFQKKYGITFADYQRMHDERDGRCDICGNRESHFGNKNKRGEVYLCVDHDHETGAVRGLLCSACNVGLGAFKDNAVTILRAVGYLRHLERKEKERKRARFRVIE